MFVLFSIAKSMECIRKVYIMVPSSIKEKAE